MTTNNIEIGKRIHDCRKKLKMSMKVLGEKVNLHESTVSRYEKGEIQALDIEKIKEFAKALNVEPEYLLNWKSESSNSINKIKELRQERNISLYELANEIHIDVDLLQKYENGTEKVPLETLEKISNFFNVSVDEITTLGLITSDQTTLITSNVRIAKMQKKWFDKVGTVNFSDEELDKIIEYALFLISQRKE